MRQNIISRLRKDQGGFTLIELMVVVVIIGLLAAVAVPQFFDQRDNAFEARKAADIKILQNAVDLYYVENGDYPTDLTTLASDAYLKAVPTDPDRDPDTDDGYTLDTTTHVVSYVAALTP